MVAGHGKKQIRYTDLLLQLLRQLRAHRALHDRDGLLSSGRVFQHRRQLACDLETEGAHLLLRSPEYT